MEDIAPELLNQLKEAFTKKYNENKAIQGLLEKLTSYDVANEYAQHVGSILAEVLREADMSVLPNGKMYYNIAKKVIEPMLGNNFELVSNVCYDVQKYLNEAVGLSLNARTIAINQSRVDNMIQEIADAETYADVSNVIPEQVKNFTQSIVDDSIRANCEFHSGLGLTAIVTRTLGSGGKEGNCKYCKRLVGVYDYEDVKNPSNQVWHRHERCTCQLTYKPTKLGIKMGKKYRVVWK